MVLYFAAFVINISTVYDILFFFSHLMGFFYRTIRMVDNGIKPVYVFDGKPPTMKGGELAKRKERREEAQKALEKATEAGMVLFMIFICLRITPHDFRYSPHFKVHGNLSY